MIDCTHEEELILTILLGVCAKCDNGKKYTFAQLGSLFQCRTEIRQHLKTHNHKFIHARMIARADVFWPEF